MSNPFFARSTELDLRDVPGADGTLITDGDAGNLSFRRDVVRFSTRRTLQVTMPARGGFVLTVDPAR